MQLLQEFHNHMQGIMCMANHIVLIESSHKEGMPLSTHKYKELENFLESVVLV